MSLTRTLARGACVAVAGLGAQVALADSISPTSYSASIGVGGTATVAKTVTVTKEVTSSKLDIFFLADTTGSMGSAISSVKTNAASLLTTTAGYGDVQWAVGEYKDVGDTFVYRKNSAFTSSQAATTTGINAWGASGGGDTPEANLFGLKSAADDSGWRAGSAKIVVWFGDAPGHDPSSGVTEAAATAALNAKGIKVEAVNNGSGGGTGIGVGLDATGQAKRIADATGGGLFPSSGAGVADAIKAAIDAAVKNYTKVCLDTSETPAGLSAASSACITGVFDRTIDRDFNFTLEFTGVAAGDYSFNTYGTVDGGRVATEADRIRVTDTVPEPGSLALLGIAALAGLRVRRRAAA